MTSHDTLTPRQAQVLQLVSQGLSSRQIAQHMGVGVRTVENHRAHICRRLGLRGPNALLRYAVTGTRPVNPSPAQNPG